VIQQIFNALDLSILRAGPGQARDTAGSPAADRRIV